MIQLRSRILPIRNAKHWKILLHSICYGNGKYTKGVEGMEENKSMDIVEKSTKNETVCEKSRGTARGNCSGSYNCSQAVTLAFADELEARGISKEMAAGLASPLAEASEDFGRYVAVSSGMALVCGALEGYTDPKAAAEKQDHYKKIQELVTTFKNENGSYICRELLAGINTDTDPVPEARTESYYKKRPCAELAACAADILERHLKENQK